MLTEYPRKDRYAVKNKYKVHGLNSVKESKCNQTKCYETLKEAIEVAERCATNATNKGNAFVIFKAILVVAPKPTPLFTYEVV